MQTTLNTAMQAAPRALLRPLFDAGVARFAQSTLAVLTREHAGACVDEANNAGGWTLWRLREPTSQHAMASSAGAPGWLAWDWFDLGGGLLARRDVGRVETNIIVCAEDGAPLPMSLQLLLLAQFIYGLSWQAEVIASMAGEQPSG